MRSLEKDFAGEVLPPMRCQGWDSGGTYYWTCKVPQEKSWDCEWLEANIRNNELGWGWGLRNEGDDSMQELRNEIVG
jgi:hypothetical protein